MQHSFQLFLANAFPFLGRMKRMFRAIVDSRLPIRPSYSQYGEDAYFLKELSEFNLIGSIYVDVGAGHPTSGSNTYLLYRKGLSGVVIEPNRELLFLHQVIRPQDIAIGVGCGQDVSLSKFQVFSTPVRSSFSQEDVKQTLARNIRISRTEYLPILPLDLILAEIEYDWICLLSIDTEGLDYEVLLGATQTLKKTLFICIEANESETEKKIIGVLQKTNFEVLRHFHCNVVLRNASIT